jgi:hypothetical protein
MAAISYIETKEQRNDNPFMMYVVFTAPHDLRQSPQSYVDKYPAESMKLPARLLCPLKSGIMTPHL